MDALSPPTLSPHNLTQDFNSAGGASDGARPDAGRNPSGVTRLSGDLPPDVLPSLGLELLGFPLLGWWVGRTK